MRITHNDWSFEIDIPKTEDYHAKQLSDLCQCGYCRNFNLALPGVYQQLCLFLDTLHTDFRAVDELMPFEPTFLEATYCICGSIIQRGNSPILLDGVRIQPTDISELDFDSSCPAPAFAIIVSDISVPWLLNEDMDEVISPANEPEYLQRMWNRWLSQAPQEDIYS